MSHHQRKNHINNAQKMLGCDELKIINKKTEKIDTDKLSQQGIDVFVCGFFSVSFLCRWTK